MLYCRVKDSRYYKKRKCSVWGKYNYLEISKLNEHLKTPHTKYYTSRITICNLTTRLDQFNEPKLVSSTV